MKVVIEGKKAEMLIKVLLLIVLFFGTVIFMMLFSGCANQSIRGECRHSAVYAAIVMGEEYPVRIISGPSYKAKAWHAQAEAQIEGEWKALCVAEDYVYVCQRHNWFEPLGYKSVRSYMEQQFDWAIESDWKRKVKY